MQLSARILSSLAFLAGTISSSQGALLTYDLAWSGVGLGNSAMATGTITVDDTLLPNPSGGVQVFSSSGGPFSNFSITVSGASSGNGTFEQSDFAGFLWRTSGGGVDLTSELAGQPGLRDFNLCLEISGNACVIDSAAPVSAPVGVFTFRIETNRGDGDTLELTSFAPAAEIPEPGTALLLLSSLGAAVAWRRRAR